MFFTKYSKMTLFLFFAYAICAFQKCAWVITERAEYGKKIVATLWRQFQDVEEQVL